MSRTKNSIKNSIISMLSNICIMLIGFISQAIFIRILGAEYIGINGLFNNILAILGIAELGIGNAIIFNLYEPLKKNDINLVKSLMKFYKKSYTIIGLIVLFIGLSITPFVNFFVGDISVNLNLKIIYILFLMQTVSTYIFSYKMSIFIASQRGYIIKVNQFVFQLVLNTLQLLILYTTKNYYLYLIIKIICQLLSNIIISIYANREFEFIKGKNNKRLDKDIERNILLRVKALFFHKVGGFVINSTDNIIISKYINVLTVGLYSNYYLIINAINTLFTQMLTSTTASVGNLILDKNKEKNYNIFKKIRFINFFIATFSGVCLLLLMQPFIKIWIGEQYILNDFILIVLVFNYFQQIMRSTYTVFIDGAAIWYENRFVPILESALNIIFSIICLKIFGLAGVFMGTIISGLSLWCYSYPKFVYKKLFDRRYREYARETLAYMLSFVIIVFISYNISKGFIINNNLLQFIINLFICLIIPNLMIIILFKKNENYTYFKAILYSLLKKIFNKENDIKCNIS